MSYKSSPQKADANLGRRRQRQTARQSNLYQDNKMHTQGPGTHSFSSSHHSCSSVSGGMYGGGSPQKNESFHKRRPNRNGTQKWSQAHSQQYPLTYQQQDLSDYHHQAPFEQQRGSQEWQQYQNEWHDGAEDGSWNQQHSQYYYGDSSAQVAQPTHGPRKYHKAKQQEQQRWGGSQSQHDYYNASYDYSKMHQQFDGRAGTNKQHDYAQFYGNSTAAHGYYGDEHDETNYYDYYYQSAPQQQRRWTGDQPSSSHQSYEGQHRGQYEQRPIRKNEDGSTTKWQAKRHQANQNQSTFNRNKANQQSTTMQWRLKKKKDRDEDNKQSELIDSREMLDDEHLEDQYYSRKEQQEKCDDFHQVIRKSSPPINSMGKVLFTDEHIPNQTQKLLIDNEAAKGSTTMTVDPLEESQQTPTVQQKYDLVSNHSSNKKKQASKDADELEKDLQDCCFPQGVNGPEPTDSECLLEQMSMRSTQTMQNQLRQAEQSNALLVRRTNSQENRVTNQFLNQSSSQSVVAASQGFHLVASQSMANLKSNVPIKQPITFGDASIRSLGKPGSSAKGGSTSGASERGILKHKLFKGVKLSKIRIIEKTTVYIIGLSPKLADKSTMIRFEYFGQYGQIQKVMIKNKEGASPGSEQQDASSRASKQPQAAPSGGAANEIGDQSNSSTKSLLSYAAHITYSTPEDASLAILALDKHVFDGRKIRASFGRTKFCKFFLQNAACPARDTCPYLHKDCKEQDILTPEDMLRKEELFLQCQQLAIKISKIADMTEAQYRNLLEHKREYLCHKNLPKSHQYVLPCVESIFENKELVKNIMLYRRSIAAMKQQAALQLQASAKKKVGKRKDKKDPATQNVVLNTTSSKLPRSNSYREHRVDVDQQPHVTRVSVVNANANTINLKDVKVNMVVKEQIRRRARSPAATSLIRQGALLTTHDQEAEDDTEVEHESIVEQFRSRWQKRLVIMSLKQTNPGIAFEEESEQEQKKDRSAGRAANRMRLRERRNSVSKSIQRGQRMNSLSSQVEYTLNYVLNDDMAITNTPQYKKEPLIDSAIDEANEKEASQIINKMIMMQQNKNSYVDYFPRGGAANNNNWPDNQSSYFQSNQDSRYFAAGGTVGLTTVGLPQTEPPSEINLQQIPKTIYTSSCFLINTQNKQRAAEEGEDPGSDDQSRRESIHQIWERFDEVERRLKDGAHRQQLDNRVNCSGSLISFQNFVPESQSQKEPPTMAATYYQPANGQANSSMQQAQISSSSSSYHQQKLGNKYMHNMLSQRKQPGLSQLIAPLGAQVRVASRSHRGSFHAARDHGVFYPQQQFNDYFNRADNYSMQQTPLTLHQRYTSSPDTRPVYQPAQVQQSISKTTQPSGSAGFSSKKPKKALQQSCSRDALFDDRQAHWNQIFLNANENQEQLSRRLSCGNKVDSDMFYLQKFSDGDRQLAQKQSNEEPISPFELGDEIAQVQAKTAKKNMHFSSRSLFSFPIIDNESAIKFHRLFVQPSDTDESKQEQTDARRRTQLDGKKERVHSHDGSQTRKLLQTASKDDESSAKYKRIKKETSAFDELMKVDALFTRGSNIRRPTSCSKSQSHSRVRRSSACKNGRREDSSGALFNGASSDRSSPMPLRIVRFSYSSRKPTANQNHHQAPINLSGASHEKPIKKLSEKTPATATTGQSSKVLQPQSGIKAGSDSLENI